MNEDTLSPKKKMSTWKNMWAIYALVAIIRYKLGKVRLSYGTEGVIKHLKSESESKSMLPEVAENSDLSAFAWIPSLFA